MTVKFRIYFSVLVATALSLSSCSTAPKTAAPMANITPVHQRTDTPDFQYTFYFKVVSSLNTPDDEIMIDTNSQMRFGTHQEMSNGDWRTPTGFAYLEAKDEDSLVTFIKRNSLFEVEQGDVEPQCPKGDILHLMIYRRDLNKTIKLQTNTCVYDFNLLTGEQRKYFPQFIRFLQRIRDVYRPAIPEKR